MANNTKRIWDTDPDAKPRERAQYQDDVVGRFRSGRLVGKQPESLNEWRVTTGDPVVAEMITGLLGGEFTEWDTDKEDNLEILTDSASVEIIIDSSDKLDSSFKKFGFSGLEHHCDGVEYLSDDDASLVGTPCGCPAGFQDRKDRAKSGKGPKPSVELTFKLADAPQSGYFRFNSSSWELVKVLHTIFEAIDVTGGAEDGKPGAPVRATLSIENVSYTTKAGRDVSYNKPVIKVLSLYVPAAQSDLTLAA
ncbi:hypothetical protein [Streptomyces sp. NPDC006638]|uniref:recombination directionality factor n=1 Tax=Streptomyces sp. NPDC006638 TaxID=3157183 RepID=UPI0033BD083C